MPVLSIIIPVYNTEIYLESCLVSISKQTLQEFEVIIVDDASTDNSLEILQSYIKKDKRFKYYCNEKNIGVSGTLNQAISHCKTDIIIRMDSDDLMSPHRLKKQYEYIQNHSDCAILGSQVKYINRDNKLNGQSNLPLSDYEIKKNLFLFQTIADSTVLFNLKRIPKKLLHFNETLRVAEGLDLYFKLLCYGKYMNLNEPLVLLRDRPDSLSKNIKKNIEVICQVRTNAIKNYGVKVSRSTRFLSMIQKWFVMLIPINYVIRLFDYFRKLLVRK